MKEYFDDYYNDSECSGNFKYPIDGGNSSAIQRWMDKHIVIYTYSEIIINLKKKGSCHSCCNMYEPWGHYAK